MNFEDGGIDGAGEKLLLLLYKMQVVDVLLAVSIQGHHYGKLSVGIYKTILQPAKVETLTNRTY